MFWNRFKNTSVEIVHIEKSSGIIKTPKRHSLAVIYADVQPYSGGCEQNEYGVACEYQKRMYCDFCEYLTERNSCVIDGVVYDIVSVEHRTFGDTAILKRRLMSNENRD